MRNGHSTQLRRRSAIATKLFIGGIVHGKLSPAKGEHDGILLATMDLDVDVGK